MRLMFRNVITSKFLSWLILCGMAVFGPTGEIFASAGSASKNEPRFLIDVPTAGMIGKGNLVMDLEFYQEGGVLCGLNVGVFDRLSLGISYGGSRLIGNRPPVMNELPGVNVKVRIIEESLLLPAIAVGFDTQGKEGYNRTLNRYAIKSPGFYAVVSKNYSFVGDLSFHGGVNYSLERADGDKDPNVFLGLEKTIGPVISLLLEYNIATNDNNSQEFGRGNGYLNAGLKWTFGGKLTLGVSFKDILKNRGTVAVANRVVNLEYIAEL